MDVNFGDTGTQYSRGWLMDELHVAQRREAQLAWGRADGVHGGSSCALRSKTLPHLEKRC